jgi:hypothetical protein
LQSLHFVKEKKLLPSLVTVLFPNLFELDVVG